ncbi:MAG: hypothetical protein ACSLFJ_14885 [Immundisolibacter sp.]|uniref:hypothetical protein n=1 Tax=Immundisolibacter sp. TaxID=1934948 RepID=UPI00356192C2
MTKALPKGYEEFQVWADVWALPTEQERRVQRMTSTQAELELFFQAVKPQLDAWIQYLNGFNLAAMAEPEKNLLNLALAVVEVSPAIELFDNPWPKDVYPWQKFTVAY